MLLNPEIWQKHTKKENTRGNTHFKQLANQWNQTNLKALESYSETAKK